MKNLTALVAGCATALLLQTALFADDVRHLNSGEAARLATAKPQPTYPPMAKQLHLEGVVQVEASIDESGSVDSVRPISGNAVLAGAAVEATKHWKFQPITESGKPSKALATLSFAFKM